MEPRSTTHYLRVGGVIAAAIAVFGGGLYTGVVTDGRIGGYAVFAGAGVDAFSPVDEANMTPYWKAWRVLDEKFVPVSSTATSTATTTAATSTVPSAEERVYGAIQGLTGAYQDPYTKFLPPKENKVFEEDISGNFEGVGMEIGIRDGRLTVVSPLEGSPAQKAGLEAGDTILAIDTTSTKDMSVQRAVQLIRGEKGTDVVLTIARDGRSEPFDISVTRDTIRIPTIETKTRDGTYIIRLHNFSAIAADLFRDALREFKRSGRDDLVIDLRNNPGGYLQAAIEMASYFLPAGKTIVTEDYGKNGDNTVHRSRGYDVIDDETNVAILVNRGSASASEILAGALTEHGIGTLVGTQTFGKGSVQELVEITDETSLKVTVARWVTPDGTVISGNGLTPEIVVESPTTTTETTDPQLERAIEFLRQQ